MSSAWNRSGPRNNCSEKLRRMGSSPGGEGGGGFLHIGLLLFSNHTRPEDDPIEGAETRRLFLRI